MLRSPWSRPLTSQGFSLPPAFALRISSRIATCSCTASSQVLPPRAKDADTDLTSSGPVIAPAEVEAPFPFSPPGAGLAAKNEVIWPRLGGDAGDDVRAFLGDEDAPQDRGGDARTDPMRLGPGGPASSSSAAAAAAFAFPFSPPPPSSADLEVAALANRALTLGIRSMRTGSTLSAPLYCTLLMRLVTGCHAREGGA